MAPSLLDRARAFATAEHEAAGCTYGAHSFDYHLSKVDEALARFGHTDETLRAAAWLHDVVEDTSVTLATISEQFGPLVAEYVDAVTDIKERPNGEPCKNRRERQLLTYAKLRTIAARYPEVINLKLADRIANFEASATGINSQHFTMYQTEHPFFCRQLGAIGGDDRMWAALDRLATIDPRRGPVRRVCKTIKDSGPHPEFHERAVEQLKSTWPTLWKALENLVQVDPL